MKKFDFYLFTNRYGERFICYESADCYKIIEDFSKIPYTAESLLEDVLDGFSAHSSVDDKKLLDAILNDEQMNRIAFFRFDSGCFSGELYESRMNSNEVGLFGDMKKHLMDYCETNDYELYLVEHVKKTRCVNDKDVRGCWEPVGELPNIRKGACGGRKMKHKELFEKAYERLMELYSGEYHSPDARILSRFYGEKMILEKSELYMRYLDFFGRVREVAERKGEHIWVRGTAGSSFIAYLLGATDINPLPRHEYCPRCRTTRFAGEGTPFDGAPKKCPCGEDILFDGHNIPFESDLKSALSEHIQLTVSYEFFKEAKRMIYDEMWDKAIVTLRDKDVAPTWFCFLDREENDDGDYMLSGNSELFGGLPRITLVPNKMLDNYRELEKATGFKMKDIGYPEHSFVYLDFIKDANISGIPNLDNDFIREIWDTVKPQSYEDILKIIGFAHSTNVWRDNGEILFDNHRMSLREIPAYREELYEMICDRLRRNGIYDTGLAYEITERARRGYYERSGGVDEDSCLSLLQLGFDMDLIFLLERINYMFPKAHGVAYLREAITMMFYKIKFNKEYNEIMLENN